MLTRSCFPMLPHSLPCRGSRGSATLPHRLPLRSIPPPRYACGSSHSRGHGRPRSVRKSCQLRGKRRSMDCRCSDRRKSFGPSAPIAYATSVSPPDEAVAWPGRRCRIVNDAAAWSGRRYWVLDITGAKPAWRCWMTNDATACPLRSSCKSPRTLPKCKYLITKELIFIAVRGGLNLCSPSTAAKVN